ncbi:MAG: biotin carboxylase N-terminal domain-containing protein [Hyphomicrobiales bacterium]
MMDSLLVANRGEIACRIFRTARRLGIRTIAVYSEIDADMPFVKEADEAHLIGPPAARESYLDGRKILDAARKSNAAAIHPGYGFLSENAGFAEAVIETGLVWIGAPPKAIRAMGLKDAAKRLMHNAGVAVTPGYMGDDQDGAHLAAEAGKIGYPVLIKAVAGGGGKGMRKVDAPDAFADALASCRREAQASFGDERVLLEKYIANPRHIEVQIFGDVHGGIVHLFERDCSLQRRHQKVIEEAPAPGMDEATRRAVCAAAVEAARAVDYVGAGTIEFVADASEGLRADRVWFMEMNTRLQVEHPVTEAITGEDLVEWQLRIAAGEGLPKPQGEIAISGWAMEARLYAENPASGFLPSTGPIRHLRLPVNIRIDSGVGQGNTVSPFYDPMLAKLIAHEPSRKRCAAKLADACRKVQVWPIKTNAGFLARLLADADFNAGTLDTGLIERHGDRLIPDSTLEDPVICAAARALVPGDMSDPWTALTGFRLAAEADHRVAVRIGDTVCRIDAAKVAHDEIDIAMIDGEQVIFADGEGWAFRPPDSSHAASRDDGEESVLPAPMPGLIVAIDVKNGDTVRKGRKLVTLEAMKMEHTLRAPFDGVVSGLPKPGAQVHEGDVLAVVEKEE